MINPFFFILRESLVRPDAGHRSRKPFNSATVILFCILLYVILNTTSSYAWTPPVHDRIAEETIALLQPALRDFLAENKRDFLKGVTDEKELFERALEQKGDFSVEYLHNAGIERFYYNYKRVQFLVERKAGDRTAAYEAGKLLRSASDLLEPLPESDDFRFVEISSNRIFFLDDVEQNIDRYRYFYARRRLIESFPGRIGDEIKNISKTADVIYDAYSEGTPYGNVERQAHETINRTINFCADTLYTLYEMKNRPGGRPFNPSAALGLEKYRRGGSNDAFDIETPEAPVVPSPGRTEQPEMKSHGADKEEKADKDDAGKEGEDDSGSERPGIAEEIVNVLLGKEKAGEEDSGKEDGEEDDGEEVSEEEGEQQSEED